MEQGSLLMTEESKRKAKDRRLYQTYGITLEEWEQMYKEQNETCFICKRLYPRMCVDHVHVPGFKKMLPEDKKKYVRGILCFMCNTHLKGLEKTKDGELNRQRLNGTVEYFQKFKLKGEI